MNCKYCGDKLEPWDREDQCPENPANSKSAFSDGLGKLVDLYEQYIDLLIKELNETSSFADIHGWKSERFNEGEKLREEIANLREKLA